MKLRFPTSTMKILTGSSLFTDLVSEPTGQVSAIFQREQFAVHSDGGVQGQRLWSISEPREILSWSLVN